MATVRKITPPTRKNTIIESVISKVKSIWSSNNKSEEQASTPGYYQSEEYDEIMAKQQAQAMIEQTKVNVMRSF